MSTWWTDERISATINRQYVCLHLTKDEQERLDRPLGFGDGLTDDTYLDWILTRARRLFFILVDIGVPDQIFYVVDESYDDDDLPIAAEAVRNLRLTYEKDATLEKRFFKTQFQYLIKNVKEGEHIRYGDEETVPVETAGHRTGMPHIVKDGIDKVYLPGSATKVYTRKRVPLHETQNFLSEDDVLLEVNSMKQFKHDHIISIFGSYTSEDISFVLLLPSAEWTLKTFLSDTPQVFKIMEKHERRRILVKWPHCLASALSFLHTQSRHHGSIRPSNILIDSNYRIFFGYLDAYPLIKPDSKFKDVEAYEYAAPERWIRASVVQDTAPKKNMLHSGGRTARKVSGSSSAPSSDPNSATSKSQRSSFSSDSFSLSPTIEGSTTASFYSNLSKKTSLATFDTFRPVSRKTATSYPPSITSSQGSSSKGRSRSKSLNKALLNYTPSIASSASSNATARPVTTLPKPVAVPAPQLHSAIFSTWQSQQHDPFPSDVFAFGAITLEILTFVCKKKLSSFAWHRSCKNRTAGRGGAPADASYHANLKQITSWIKTLRKVAFDKEDEIFRAVDQMLDVAGQMLVKEPEARPSTEHIEQRFEEALISAGTQPHCIMKREERSQRQDADIRASAAIRSSVDTFRPAKRSVRAKHEAQPPVPALPPQLQALLGQESHTLESDLPQPPSLPELHNTQNASSSSLSSSGFSFETSGFRWDDFEDGEDDESPSDLRPAVVGLPRQDSITTITTIPEFDFPPPIRHSSIINGVKLDLASATTGSGEMVFGNRLVRSRTPQSATNFSRNWRLPSADEVDEALGAD